MEITVKAGCFLVDVKTGKIALIFREKQRDITFPKGHLEKGESIKECAIRETEEETKRACKIVEEIEPLIEEYTNSINENCECYMFVATDCGKSDNTSTDTHTLVWTDVEEVEEKLSYKSLKKDWRKIKPQILKILEKKLK